MTIKITGKAFGWFETGTEGVIWALQKDGVEGYDGLFVIEAGDWLEIYASGTDDKLLFQGIIEPDLDTGKVSRPLSQLKQIQALGFWVHWIQRGFHPDSWASLFMPGDNSAVLTRKEVGHP